MGAILRRRHCHTSYSPRNYDTSHDDHEEMQDFYFYVCSLWLSLISMLIELLSRGSSGCRSSANKRCHVQVNMCMIYFFSSLKL